MADVLAAGLAEGELTVSGTFQRIVETTTQQDTDTDTATPPVPVTARATKPLNGAVHTLLKDLVAPVAPTVSPAGGQYIGSQSVTLSPEDEIEDTVRYRIGTSAVPDPTSASPAATGQIAVSTSQTIKSRSFDRAGNPSPVVTSAYDIRTDIVPGPPSVTRVTPADAAIDVTWAAPASNGGSAITGYVLRAHQAGTIVAEVSATGNSGRITGLVNGTDYTVTVTAVNASGDGAPSAPSVSVSPRPPLRAPFSPTIGTASLITGGANVTWTPPTSNGGSALTGYVVTLFDSGTGAQVSSRSVAATVTNAQFTGLTNGRSYQFDVRAVNAQGTGDPSDRSNSVLVAVRSTAPLNVLASAGNASAIVSWAEPTNTGGAEVDSYQVQVRTGTTVVDLVDVFDTEVEVFGLTNGTAYNFRVAAVTTAGVGALSQATAPVTPRAPQPVVTVATAPTTVAATRGNASATVTWGAPTNASTSNITGYRVRRYAGGTATGALQATTTYPATARSAAITGLTNGTSYRFDVTAISGANPVTFGAASARTGAVIPATTPGAPTVGTAVAGAAGGAITATANWTPPTTTGGSAITGYRVTALRMSATGTVLQTTESLVQPATSRSLQMTLPALGNYRFTVQAINAVSLTGGTQSARSNLVAGR
jgi:hypothetical protein